MNFNIEIKESDIKSAIEYKVAQVIAEQARSHSIEMLIKEQVKKQWPVVIEQLIKESLKDVDTVKSIIAAEMQRKLKSQLSAIMKDADKI